MMAKRPEDRLQSAEEVIRALRPLASEHIAGRPMVTASVQSAADTHRTSAADGTIALDPVFKPLSGSVVTAMQRRRQSANPSKWVIAGLVLAGLVLALGGILLNRPSSRPITKQPDAEATPPSAPQASPPAEYRVEFAGHWGVVLPGDWSPDGYYLATRGGDGQVRVWDADGKRTLATYAGHSCTVRHVQFSADGRRIASTDARGAIHVWEAQTGKAIDRIERPSEFSNKGDVSDGAAFSPDGTEIAYLDGMNVVRYSLEQRRPIWSAPCSLQHLKEFASYSPDGRYLAVGSPNSKSVHPLVWEIATGDLIYQHQADGNHAFGGFTSDNRLLIVVENSLRLVNPENGDVVQEWPLDGEYNGHGIQMRHRSNSCVVSRKTTPRNSPFEELVHLPTGDSKELPQGVLLSPDGKRYVGSDGSRRTIVKIDGTVINRGFGVVELPTPYDLRLLGGRYVRTGWGWFDLAEARIVSQFPDAPFLLPDGRLRGIVANRVVEWPNVKSLGNAFEMVCELQDARDYTRDLRWSDDGKTIWGIRVTDRICQSLRFWNAEAGTIVRTVESERLKRRQANSYQWFLSQAGDVLAAHQDGELTTWNFGDGSTPLECKSNVNFMVSLSPDGRRLAGRRNSPFDSIQLLETATGSPGATVALGLGDFAEYGNVAQFSPSHDYLLTALQVWDLREDEPERLWECAEASSAVGPILGNRNYHNCAWFPDEEHVLICQDAQYQVWNWRNNEKLFTLLILPEQVWAAVNHRNGHWAGSPLAYRDMRCRMPTADGKSEWVTVREYEKQTGYVRDPSQVGLDFLRDPSDATPPPTKPADRPDGPLQAPPFGSSTDNAE